MKDSLKNAFPLDGKKTLFVLARKSVSTTRNEVFLEKYISTTKYTNTLWKTASSGKKHGKWFPLVGKYFSVKTDSL